MREIYDESGVEIMDIVDAEEDFCRLENLCAILQTEFKFDRQLGWSSG